MLRFLGGLPLRPPKTLNDDLDMIIGRPEIGAWEIIFTPEGPKPRKVPMEFKII